jgi:hypothetical protein
MNRRLTWWTGDSVFNQKVARLPWRSPSLREICLREQKIPWVNRRLFGEMKKTSWLYRNFSNLWTKTLWAKREILVWSNYLLDFKTSWVNIGTLVEQKTSFLARRLRQSEEDSPGKQKTAYVNLFGEQKTISWVSMRLFMWIKDSQGKQQIPCAFKRLLGEQKTSWLNMKLLGLPKDSLFKKRQTWLTNKLPG